MSSSGTYFLDSADSPRKDACFRFLLVLILLGVISIAVLLGCYAFSSSKDSADGCAKQPELDPYGLSNWTQGSQIVAFGCFPGHQIEGHTDVVMSQCIQNAWVPPPPACAVLPLRLNCKYQRNGVQGTVSMWQVSSDRPAFVQGILNVAKVDPSRGFLRETIDLSRSTCEFTSAVASEVMPEPLVPNENEIEVRFSSAKLLAYKKAQLKLTLVFIDPRQNLRFTVVSLHQGQETLVMASPPIIETEPKNEAPLETEPSKDQGHGEVNEPKENPAGPEETVEKVESKNSKESATDEDGASHEIVGREDIPERQEVPQ